MFWVLKNPVRAFLAMHVWMDVSMYVCMFAEITYSHYMKGVILYADKSIVNCKNGNTFKNYKKSLVEYNLQGYDFTR